MSRSDGPDEMARPDDRNRVRNAGDTAADERQSELERVRSDLGNLEDEPVPEWVAKRLDDAIAEEAANTSEDTS